MTLLKTEPIGGVEPSPAVVTFRNVIPGQLNSSLAPAILDIQGDQFSLEPTKFAAFNGDERIPSSQITITPTTLSIAGLFHDGLNDIIITAHDSSGKSITLEGKFWAGSQTVTVNGVDIASRLPVTNVDFEFLVQQEQEIITVKASSASGSYVLKNVPRVTQGDPNLLIRARALNKAGSIPVLVKGSLTLPVLMRTLGSSASALRSAVPSLLAASQPISAVVGENPLNISVAPTLSERVLCGYLDGDTLVDCSYDLSWNVITTSILIPPTARAFDIVGSGTGGWGWVSGFFYGPDGLPQSNDQVFGFTGVGPLKLESSRNFTGSSVLEIEVGIYQRGDAAASLNLTKLIYYGASLARPSLQDFGSSDGLVALSIDPDSRAGSVHRSTPIGAAISALLSQNDRIANVRLLIHQGSRVVPIPASSSAQALITERNAKGGGEFALYDRDFFVISPSNASLLQFDGPPVSLSVEVTTELGEVVERFYGDLSPSILRLLIPHQLSDTFRYNRNSDQEEGGDFWGRPHVISLATRLCLSPPPGILFQVNDFSNMHGGKFRSHKSHRFGLSVDARFPGIVQGGNPPPGPIAAQNLHSLYSALSRAEKLQIRQIYLKFGPGFVDEILRISTSDRSFSAIFRVLVDDDGHKDHIHFEFKDAN